MNNICLYTNIYTVGVLSDLVVFHFVRHKSQMDCRENEPWCPLYYLRITVKLGTTLTSTVLVHSVTILYN